MCSDLLALSIGFYATYVSKKPTTNGNTFGWIRSEVIGALINCTFLLANCFNILLEAIHRFYELDDHLEDSLGKNVD